MRRCVRGRDRTSRRNWPEGAKVLLCAMAMGLVAIAHSQPIPDTILLPDSLGPLRPGYHLAFGSSTDNIYVASESSDIIVVDGNTFQRIKRINTGTPVGGALLVSQHNKLYCSYPSRGRIGIIDCATNDTVGSIPVSTRPKLLCYSSGSDKLYCGDTMDQTVSVIDCATNALMKVIPVGDGLTAMVYDPTTNKVYVATRDAVRAISCSADSVIANLDEIKSATDMCINKRRQKLYVVRWQYYSFTDTIYVVSTPGDSVIAEMAAGWRPLPRLVCNEATDRLYVAVNGDGHISEFDCVGDTLIRLGPLPDWSEVMVCDSVRNRLYNLTRRNDAGVLRELDCVSFLFTAAIPVGGYSATLEADPTRYRIMYANLNAANSVLAVFDHKQDTIHAVGAIPLYGWSQVIWRNSATGNLYIRWCAGVVGGAGVTDEQANRVVAQAFLPGRSTEVMAYSRTSNKLYFQVEYGPYSNRRGLGVMDGDGDSMLKVIDLGEVYADACPTWCQDGDRVYCFAEDGLRFYIAVVDCRTDSIVRTLDVYDIVKWFEYLGGERMLCFRGESLSLLDCRTDSILVDSAIGTVSASAHTSDGKKVYAVRPGGLEVRSTSSLSLLTTITWPYFGWSMTFLAYSDVTKKLYWIVDDSVLAIDATSDTVAARLSTSVSYKAACFDHTGRYLFCASHFDSTIRVYDTEVDSLVGTYRFLPPPSTNPAITSDPERGCIYVGCEDVILVWPDAPPGVEEAMDDERGVMNTGASVVRDVLLFDPPSGCLQRTTGELLDVSGRRVKELRPRENDVRALAPGVYFVRSEPLAASREPSAVMKVVVTR